MITEKMNDAFESPSVHRLTTEILRLALDRDCVDAYYDTLHAAELLKERMEILTDRPYK